MVLAITFLSWNIDCPKMIHGNKYGYMFFLVSIFGVVLVAVLATKQNRRCLNMTEVESV